MAITFKLNTKDAEKMFGNVAKAINNLKPALEIVSGMQLKEVQNQFKTEGSNITGKKWHKLTKGTIKARLRAGFGASPILTASGKMRKANKKKKLTNKRIEIGNDTKYFQYHQNGKGRMNRQVYGHSAKMIKKTLDTVSDYIIKRAKA